MPEPEVNAAGAQRDGNVTLRTLRFLWPSDLHPQPNLLQRAGRVVHWFFAGIAALFVVLLAAMVLEDGVEDLGGVVVVGAFAIGAALLGRAFRYILAAE